MEKDKALNAVEKAIDLAFEKGRYHEEYFCESELQKKMAVPRLEMRLERTTNNADDWSSICWTYGIVYKHYSTLFNNNDEMLFIPLSKTTSTTGVKVTSEHYFNKQLDLPYRDGVHIYIESKLFNLPAYIICEEKKIVQKIEELDLATDIDTQLSKMKRESKI